MAALQTEDGTRITRGAFPASAQPAPETTYTVDEDVYIVERFPGESDPFGTRKSLRFRAGRTIRESEIDAAFPAATISAVTPNTGPAAGGTAITITGENLDGVTAVTVGGAAATGVSVTSPTEVAATTPAGTAGARDVVVTDDSGTSTASGAFTYT